jgi:DNA-binding NarL/FixJ family response regulator
MKLSEKRVRNLLSSVYSKFDLHESGKINVRIAAINRACDLGLLASD